MNDLDLSKGIAVFSDGSANTGDRSGGWAWVALDAFGNMATDSGFVRDTTVNRMELLAPTNALYQVHKVHGPSAVLIYCDSQYVVLGCQDRTRKRNKNKTWWQALDKAIALHNHVEWTHIRGHGNSLYNNLADKLAGEARKAGINGRKDISNSW